LGEGVGNKAAHSAERQPRSIGAASMQARAQVLPIARANAGILEAITGQRMLEMFA